MAGDPKGVLTTLSNALPTGLDGTRIAQWKLRDGYTYDAIRADIVASMNGVNMELLSAWGDMIYVTPEDFLEYPTGGSIYKMPRLSDLDRPNPRKGVTSGHSIDLWKVGDAVGGTEDFFMDARASMINSTVAQIIRAGRNTFEVDLLTRFFTNTENLLGTTGYDVGFCDASSTVQFAPLMWGGKTFTTSHNHYAGYDTGSSKTWADVLDGLALNLNEHGHEPPYIAIVPETDTATIRALTNYIKPIAGVIIDRGGATSGNQYFMDGQTPSVPAVGGRFIGEYDSSYGRVYLKATNRLTTGYGGMYKSYGTNDPRNPIYVRIHPEIGFGFYIKEIPSFVTTWPVKTIEVYKRYGVSCGRDRTAGAAGLLVSGGAWSNATIS